MGHLPLP
jgi:hypothetical protein